MDRIKWIVLLLILSGGVTAQNRYMVFFANKIGTPYSVASPEEFLSARSIERRINQGITIVEQDIPVVESYVTDVRNASTTIKVLYRSKWMNGILVECLASDVSIISALPFVNAVEYVAPGVRPGARTRSSSGKFAEAAGLALPTDAQISMIGLNDMHAEGYHGEGILIAIMDAGFPGADTISYFEHIFDENRFDAETSYDFVSGSSNVFKKNNHGTHVWSIMAGYKPGAFVGGAYKANYMLFITEYAPTEYRVEEYNWLFAVERADSAGVDVVNTSLGYSTFDASSMNYSKSQMDGNTAVITRAANMAASKGIAVVVSAGNEGSNSWGIITAPADNEHVFTVGSVGVNGIKASTSSVGPTSDNRIKPDVVALGNPTSYVGQNGAIGSGTGTSYSSPLVASLVAGVWQKFPEFTVEQLFDRIRNHASQSGNPDNELGYGIPNFIDVVLGTEADAFTKKLHVFPNPLGKENQLRVTIGDSSSPHPVIINLYDNAGRRLNVNMSQVAPGEFILDTSILNAGLYLMRCQQGKSVATKKFIKLH